LEFFAEKTPKFRSKGALEEESFYTTKTFKEIGTLDRPVSS
jgi:hypothetical protein